MKILGINDIYDDLIEINITLDNDDPRIETAKQIDKEDYDENCFMLHVMVQENEIKGMMLSYIPYEGGYEEIGLIEMGSKEWNNVKVYLNNNL